jgi:hypothetical protein
MNMMEFARIVHRLNLTLGMLLLGGCASFRIVNENPKENAPLAAQAVDVDTGVAYFDYERRWYQLTTSLNYGSRQDSTGRKVTITSISSLRRFEPSTEKYEDFVGGKSQKLRCEFTVGVNSDGQLEMLYSRRGGEVGSITGLKDTHFDARLVVESPNNFFTSKSFMIVTVTGEARMTNTRASSFSGTSNLAGANVTKHWKFVIKPDGDIESEQIN